MRHANMEQKKERAKETTSAATPMTNTGVEQPKFSEEIRKKEKNLKLFDEKFLASPRNRRVATTMTKTITAVPTAIVIGLRIAEGARICAISGWEIRRYNK